MWLNTSRGIIQKVGPEGLNIKGTLLKPYTPHKLNTTTKTKGEEGLHRRSVKAQLVVSASGHMKCDLWGSPHQLFYRGRYQEGMEVACCIFKY